MGFFDRIAGELGELIATDDVRVHVERGAEFLATGELEAAIRELQRALALRPDSGRAAFLLGVAELRRGNVEAALAALQQAETLREGDADVALALAEARHKKGDLAQAAEGYRKALEGGLSEATGRTRAHLGLGEIHLAQGRTDRAVRELRKAVAAAPSLEKTAERRLVGRAQAMLGEALLGRGDLDAARRVLERATADLTPAPGNRDAAERVVDAVLLDEPQGPARAFAPDMGEAADDDCNRAALSALGRIYRLKGQSAEARSLYRRALDHYPGDALLRLDAAALELDHGDAGAVLAEAERIRLERPGDPAAIELVARAQLALGKTDAALDSTDALVALSSGFKPRDREESAEPALRGEKAWAQALARAVRIALRAEDRERGHRYAGRALSLIHALHRPSAATTSAEESTSLASAETQRAGAIAERVMVAEAEAALALWSLAAGDLEEAEAHGARADAVETLETRLAHAALMLARGLRAEAAEALRRAITLSGTDDHRARKQLARLYREEREAPPRDLYALLAQAHRELGRVPETANLALDAARALEHLDRPLLLTVMGEFNAGKSSFVNAFVGEEVAPMGITPTTATINVLKYGAERGGRVVYLDDTVRAIPWEEVGPLLRGLDDDEARRIRYVEVLYPLESLQRVNVVDTPGLNSIRPEHEATARGFIQQADAVIWLFSCRQPGTASEREALARVQEEGKQALGVLNMIDLVGDGEGDDGHGEVAAVLAHLRSSFVGLVEALVPFSAKRALHAQRVGDAQELAASNRPELLAVLEERFFLRAQAIKRASARRRLGHLLDEATRRSEAALETGQLARVEAAEVALGAVKERFFTRFVVEERLQLIADLDEVYSAAAREVLDFARPRRWAFGSNAAAPADRDFLSELVEQQLAQLADRSRQRVEAEAQRISNVLAAVEPGESEAFLNAETRVLGEQVYGRYQAFARGFLRGGRIDRFFAESLPKLELGEHTIRRSLVRDMPALDVLEAELFAPLSAWGERLIGNLAARLERRRREEELRRLEVEERRVAPVHALAAALAEETALGALASAHLTAAPPAPAFATTPEPAAGPSVSDAGER